MSGRERRRRESCNTKERDTAAVITIGTEPNSPLAYAPGLEHHRPTIIKIWGNEYQLER